MTPPSRRKLERTLKNLHRALEKAENALVEFEEVLRGESTIRPEERKEHQLLSIPETCQELGMGKSWVYKKIRSGEIPSVKFGRAIKVKRQDLQEYIERHRHETTTEEQPY